MGIAVCNLLAVARQLCIQLGAPRVQLGLAVINFLFCAGKLGFCIRQLGPACLQLLRGIRQFGFGFRLALLVFCPGVVQLGLCLTHNLVIPQFGPLVLYGIQPGIHLPHLFFIGGRKRVQLARAVYRNVEGGVIIHLKGAVIGIGKQGNGARAHIGIFGFYRKIGGRAHGAHHGERIGQGVRDAFFVICAYS